MTARKRYKPGRPRKHERRGPGRKVHTFIGAPIRDFNASAVYVVVRDILNAAHDLARRETELDSVRDALASAEHVLALAAMSTPDAKRLKESMTALTARLPFPIGTIDDAARAARALRVAADGQAQAIAALRAALPAPIRTVDDAARAAELWFAKRGMSVPAARARRDYFARRHLWTERQAKREAENNSHPYLRQNQALARLLARLHKPN